MVVSAARSTHPTSGSRDPACELPAGTSLANCGTEFDRHRFWWDLTSDESIAPQVLTDIYVDMCPTNWSRDDTFAGDWRPGTRLEISMGYHQLTPEFLANESHGVSR